MVDNKCIKFTTGDFVVLIDNIVDRADELTIVEITRTLIEIYVTNRNGWDNNDTRGGQGLVLTRVIGDMLKDIYSDRGIYVRIFVS